MTERLGVDHRETDDCLAAVSELLQPLARLMIHYGVTYPMIEAALQRAYLDAACDGFMAEGERVTASRLYMLTGIHRKKVAQLTREHSAGAPPPPVPLAMQVRDRLFSDPTFLDRRGRPKPLPVSRREGGEHSFEALVEAVSRDVHPRTILEQWLHSNVANYDDQGRLVLAVFGPHHPAQPGRGPAALRRMLHPVVQVLSQYALQELRGGGWIVVRVENLNERAAIELGAQAREEMRRLAERQNLRAERRARRDMKRQQGGHCALVAGGFQWVEGLKPAPASVADVKLPARSAARTARARAKEPGPA
jgi:Family of unknown function (DUF6502)